MNSSPAFQQLVQLSQKIPTDYHQCLQIVKQLWDDGFDLQKIAHGISNSKLQLMILGAKSYKNDIKHEYIVESFQQTKILNRELKDLIKNYLTSFDDSIKEKIFAYVYKLNKVDESNYQRILAIADEELFWSFFGFSDWLIGLSIYDISTSMLILSRINNHQIASRWMFLLTLLKSVCPNYNFQSIEDEIMMNNFAKHGFLELVAILYSNGAKLSVDFSNGDYCDWLMRTSKDKDLCSIGSLLLQKSLYGNDNLFYWLVSSPHFIIYPSLTTNDRWHPALSSCNIRSIQKLHEIDPLTQQVINSSNYWEINSVKVLEFLQEQKLHVSIKQLITDNCQVLMAYKQFDLSFNLNEFQTLFFIWYAIEQKCKEVLDWFPTKTIYHEVIDFFQSRPSSDEIQRFLTFENIVYIFDYLFARDFENAKVRDIYEICLCEPRIETMNYFFNKLMTSYQDRLIVAINTRNIDIVRHFYQCGESWPIDIECYLGSKSKIELFLNTTVRNEFSCPRYRVGYNRNQRKEMVMAVDNNGKWLQ